MRPEPLALHGEEEKDLLLSCSFERAKQIGSIMSKVFEYGFFSVDGLTSGLYVEGGTGDEKYAFLEGYATAIDDMFSKLLES